MRLLLVLKFVLQTLLCSHITFKNSQKIMLPIFFYILKYYPINLHLFYQFTTIVSSSYWIAQKFFEPIFTGKFATTLRNKRGPNIDSWGYPARCVSYGHYVVKLHCLQLSFTKWIWMWIPNFLLRVFQTSRTNIAVLLTPLLESRPKLLMPNLFLSKSHFVNLPPR